MIVALYVQAVPPPVPPPPPPGLAIDHWVLIMFLLGVTYGILKLRKLKKLTQS